VPPQRRGHRHRRHGDPTTSHGLLIPLNKDARSSVGTLKSLPVGRSPCSAAGARFYVGLKWGDKVRGLTGRASLEQAIRKHPTCCQAKSRTSSGLLDDRDSGFTRHSRTSWSRAMADSWISVTRTASHRSTRTSWAASLPALSTAVVLSRYSPAGNASVCHVRSHGGARASSCGLPLTRSSTRATASLSLAVTRTGIVFLTIVSLGGRLVISTRGGVASGSVTPHPAAWPIRRPGRPAGGRCVLSCRPHGGAVS